MSPHLTPALKIRLKKITLLAIPAGANSFLDIFATAMVLFFIGQLGDLHIVAVGVSLNFIMLFFAITAIFYIGTNAQISRYFGAKQHQRCQEVFSTLFLSVILISIPLIFLAKILADGFFVWMQISQESLLLAQDFIHIVIFSLPSIFAKNIIVSSLAAIGNTISTFIVRIFSTILSLLLNYIFIVGIEMFGLKMGGAGIVGAGIANVLGAYLELGLLLIMLHQKSDFLKGFFWNTKCLFTALRIGIPAGIERALTLFSLVLTTKFIANYGDLAIAGAQIGTRIEGFSFMPGFGFMTAAMVLMGQNLGAGKIALAALYTRTILFFSGIVLGISGVILVVFAKDFGLIFSQDPQVLRVCVYYLIAVGFSQIPMICSFVLDGALRGAGITQITLMVNAISIWCFRILPIWLITRFHFEIQWIFAMIFMETYIRCFIFFAVFRTGIWKRAGSEI